MSHAARQYTPFVVTSSGSPRTTIISPCSDASSITVTIASTVLSSGPFQIQVSLYDPAIGGTQAASTGFAFLQVSATSDSIIAGVMPGQAYRIPAVAFHQIRLVYTATAGSASTGTLETSGTIVGWATKQISV
jgi:hypothetical protein